MRRRRVFISSPYALGDRSENVRRAVAVADALVVAGYAPYCPLLNHFWDLMHPHPPQFWYDLDNEWMAACDAVLRLPGESVGADAEVKRAEKYGIPVYRIERGFDSPAEVVDALVILGCWPQVADEPAGKVLGI